MKFGIGMCHVTEETAQSITSIVNIIVIITIIIIIIIITNTITTTIQTSACSKWQKSLSQRSCLDVTEQACWDKSTNLNILTNCRMQ
jgi:hypothetical protein